MNKKILAIILLLLFKFSLAVVPASVDHAELALGQSLTLTITLPDSGDKPDLEVLRSSFDIYGTSSSSETSIINGKVSSRTTFSVELLPKNPGKQAIPPIKVGNDATLPISIIVKAAANGGNHQALNNDSPVAVSASLARQNTYAGVPIVYTLKIYYTVSVGNLTMVPMNLPNAQIEPLGKALNYQSTENGKNYAVIEQRFLVTAKEVGKITIPPLQLNGTTPDNSGNNFFGLRSGRAFTIKSNPLTLTVKPIPDGIRRSDWLPAKQLRLSETWSKNSDTLKVGDPLTRTISLEAQGVPASTIPDIKFVTPAGVNAYPDKPVTDTTLTNDDVVAHKSFKIAYIATKAGKLRFPEVKISWWDITTDSLKTATLPAKSYTITAVDGSTIVTTNNSASQPIAKTASGPKVAVAKAKSIWYYLAIALGFLWVLTIIIIVVIVKRKSRGKTASVVNDKQSQVVPYQIATKRQALAAIHSACNNHDSHALHKALLVWAEIQLGKKIYTLNEINDLINDERLKLLIDKLNLDLYANEPFQDFTELAQVIDSLKVAEHGKDAKSSMLKDFYPK